MYKPLIAAFLFASACAHAPAAVPKAPEPAIQAAPPAPCVMTPPLDLTTHKLGFMAPPEDGKAITPNGDEVEVTTFRIYKPSVVDFFMAARILNDWAQAAWKACGGSGR